MDTATLKKLRSIIPGTLLIAGAIPLYTFWTKKPLGSIQGVDWIFVGAGLVAAYVLGAVYNLLCLRAAFNGKSHARITANIKNRLLTLRTLPLSNARREELCRRGEVMDVFYALVDSDDTLKERAKLVRDNGLHWSTIADVVVLGVAFTSLYVALWFTTDYTPFLYWCVASAILTLVGLLLHPLAERRHVQLSNTQLEFIANQMRVEAEQKIDAL
jgi:hypothetical protein